MEIEIWEKGMESAAAMIETCKRLGSTTVGVYAPAINRGKANNRKIIEYLAEGVQRSDGRVVKRDIRLTDEDRTTFAAEFVRRCENRLALTAKAHPGRWKKQGSGKPTAHAWDPQQLANNAAASGFRAAGKLALAKLRERMEAGVTNDGSAAELVEQKRYAPRRQRRYDVPPAVIFKASGLLLQNVQPNNLKLTRTMSLAQKLGI